MMVAMSQKENFNPRSKTPPAPLERVPSEDPVYGDDDQDGAQSVMQPALSAVATRLTLPKTSAAEKAAAMERRPSRRAFDSGLPSSEESSSSPELTPFPDEIPTNFEAEPDMRISPSPPSRRQTLKLQKPRPAPKERDLPSPWHASPRTGFFTGGDREGHKSALESISFGQTRHKRSSSTGADALKRFSKALPSFPAPSSIFNSFSFFSAAAEKSEQKFAANQRKSTLPQTGNSYPNTSTELHGAAQPHQVEIPPQNTHVSRPSVSSSRPSTARPRALRRVTSDDSLLYHSLSRTSSIGDDDGRFDHVREMANVRMKAIKDSLPERPTFKMPSLPKLPSSLKLNEDVTNEMPTTKLDPDDPAILDRVLETLTGDIVILGGYRGSILRSAEPPHHQLWAPVKIGLNMRKADLEVGLNPEDEESMEERIIPSGMLQNIGPIDISRKLFRKIASCDNVRKGKLRLWDYGYDWRLSPHLLSRKMIEFLEKLPSNQPDTKEPRGALVLAHSLGGLITRHVVNQRPELFSGVVYVGTPQRCINVLGPIRNGDAVLLNEKILTAQVNFSLRTTFVFLPEDGACFVNKDTKEEYRINFHDVNDWIKYRLSPCIEAALPPLNPKEKSNTFSSLLPHRSRASSDKKHNHAVPPSLADAARRAQLAREGNMNPQIDNNTQQQTSLNDTPSPFTKGVPGTPTPPNRARNLAYLKRTLAEVKRFRAETQYNPAHTKANVYPPLGVIYGKEIPTVYAVKVSSRDAIAHADAYDDLIFRAGDGVVLAREAQLPEGYELVRGGRVSTERGHLTMLGDMPAVGKALEAVVRGRRKGIGLGHAGAQGTHRGDRRSMARA
ncbi:uncharacterized protein CTRU02_212621 [Colletotrichum truncatum]|uniref:Uncharacterized protein n=1 Tax=Colletotrichum truncatum TaxID=5467 RepID=A0ACC3YIC4_COLTU|nr:uncharacterized protein CTRU02_05306 [Colletotrichum truncatum]KAF6794473.1 hypothetical protein CTRU02_05306 [Colletotrichum truncatum]